MFNASRQPTADADYQQGAKLLADEKYRDALTSFSKALQIDAKHEASRVGKCQALRQLAAQAREEKDLVVAEGYLRQARELQPDSKIHAELAAVRQQRYQQKQVKADAPVSSSSSSASSSAAPASPAAASSVAPQRVVHNLVFQGGGIKELACLGALEALSQQVNLAEVKRVGGTSAGAILATLWGVGFSLAELNTMMSEIKFTEFMDGEFREALLNLGQRKEQLQQVGKGLAADLNRIRNITSNPFAASSGSVGLAKASSNVDIKTIKQGLALLNNQTDFGLFPGDYFREWLENYLQAKTGIAHLTFKELQTLRTQQPQVFKDVKDIYVVGANISTGMTEVFSHETTPDVIISDAVRISISIPLVFRPHRLYVKDSKGERVPANANHWYVDGGLLDNYPLAIFDKARYHPESQLAPTAVLQNPYSLGLRLVDKRMKQAYQTGSPLPAKEPPTSLGGFAWQLLDTMYHKQESDHYLAQAQSRTIYIDHNGILATQFDLSPEQQQQLLTNGKTAVAEYFAAYALAKALPAKDDKDQKTPLAKDEKSPPLAVSQALAAMQQQQSTLEQAVAANDIPKVQQLLLQGAKPKPASGSEPSLLDTALAKNHKALLVVLVSNGIYACQQPKAVQAILLEALQSEFVDKASLTAHLQAFEKYHSAIFTAQLAPALSVK